MTDARFVAGDERGLVVKTLLILLVVLAVGGVAVADAGSIILAKFRVADAAQTASEDAAFTYKTQGEDLELARQAAVAAVAEADAGAKLKGFAIDAATGAVTLTVVKKVSTLVVDQIGFLKGFRKAESTATAQPPV